MKFADFSGIRGTYLRENVHKTNFFEFVHFFFLFSFVEEFQFSLNFESSVRLSFGRVHELNFIFKLLFIESF